MQPLPAELLENLRSGRCILFLGRGTAAFAKHSSGKQALSDAELSSLLAEQFLDASYGKRPLAEVAELASSETNLATMQGFLASIFDPYQPGDAHKHLPSFYWQAIVTTVYDLTVERAYDQCTNRLQRCVPFMRNGDKVDLKIADTSDLMYIKLHGCITQAKLDSNPIILTTDQYALYQSTRSRLFERLQEFALEYPLIAIGSSLSDPDLRALLQLLSVLNEARPNSYVVVPRFSPADERFWNSRRFSCIKMTFDSFMTQIASQIPMTRRILAPFLTDGHPILRRAIIPGNPQLSEKLRSALEQEFDYLYAGYKSEPCNPKEFYRGYLQDWSPIAQKLDVQRTLAEQVLTDTCLPSENEILKKGQLYIIKGHAGSGKTVLLRRIAWDAATVFDKLCLYLKADSLPDTEILRQIYALTEQRIFLFIDGIGNFIDDLDRFLGLIQKKSLPVTIIGTMRPNLWNALQERMDPLTSLVYELDYLRNTEIEQLINLLTIHKSLGHLEGLPRTDQIEALATRAGRQLLVALHEATLGRLFADIVFDEYKSINQAQARSLYLTVCVLHSLDIPVRAGLISRVHGIPFSHFKNQLFAPLDSIVFARSSRTYKDHDYVTRHPHIAEMVVERALVEGQARFDEYTRIINSLDVDYDSDRHALNSLLNARYLRRCFADDEMARNLFEIAEKRFTDLAAIMHQHAIFEMNSLPPSFDAASRLLQRALKIEPRSRIISHSLAELARKRAEHSSDSTERNRYRTEARHLLSITDDSSPGVVYSYHSRIKLLLDELMEIDGEGNDIAFEEKVKETEKSITHALNKFPGNSHLLESQSRLYTYLQEHPRALAALKKAFDHNKHSTYLSLSLAKLYDQHGDTNAAIKVLRESLEASPNDKEINFTLAKRLLATEGRDSEIQYHLRRSFVIGDARYDAQFMYARFLYLKGEISEAKEYFSRLRNVDLPYAMKMKPTGYVAEAGRNRRFTGVVISVDPSHAFILRDQFQDRIFCHSRSSHSIDWTEFRPQKRVVFEIAFNFLGPMAMNVQFEANTEAISPRKQASMQKSKILFLAANPKATDRLALDKEARDLEARIRSAEHRDALELKTRWAVQPDDLLQALNEDRPEVVHFSGHGVGALGIILQDTDGGEKLVTTQALTRLFKALKDNIRLVVLNACYSSEQGIAVSEVIDCVIGMKGSIGDDAARIFSSSFYRALGFGRSVQNSFEQGIAAIALERLDEEDIPELIVRNGADANKLYIVDGSSVRR